MIYTTINAADLDDYIKNDKEIYLIDKKEKQIWNLNNLLFYKVNTVIRYTEINKDGRYEFFIEGE